MSETYADLGGGIGTAKQAVMERRPRVGFIPGSECPKHRGYPLETTDGLCARCRRDQEEN